jgi:hypothetical protein
MMLAPSSGQSSIAGREFPLIGNQLSAIIDRRWPFATARPALEWSV